MTKKKKQSTPVPNNKAQKAIDKANYQQSKKEVMDKPKDAKVMAGKGSETKFRKAGQVAKRTGTDAKDLSKVRGKDVGRVRAHGVVDQKSGKAFDMKKKYVKSNEDFAKDKKKSETTFRQEANAVTRDKAAREKKRQEAREARAQQKKEKTTEAKFKKPPREQVIKSAKLEKQLKTETTKMKRAERAVEKKKSELKKAGKETAVKPKGKKKF